ncbi:MAG: hypothetical protein ABI742_10920 [Gemmatimonadota bacterium]
MYCLGLLGTLAACEMLGPPSALPAKALLVLPPVEYQTWWSETEACSGLSGNLDAVEWYIVPDAATFETDGGRKVGLWSHSNQGVRIILAGDYVDNELVVRHEMLHALLDREGHPSDYFESRCQLTWATWHNPE